MSSTQTNIKDHSAVENATNLNEFLGSMFPYIKISDQMYLSEDQDSSNSDQDKAENIEDDPDDELSIYDPIILEESDDIPEIDEDDDDDSDEDDEDEIEEEDED